MLLLNIYEDQLIVLTADCHITVYNLQLSQTKSGTGRMITSITERKTVEDRLITFTTLERRGDQVSVIG